MAKHLNGSLPSICFIIYKIKKFLYLGIIYHDGINPKGTTSIAPARVGSGGIYAQFILIN